MLFRYKCLLRGSIVKGLSANRNRNDWKKYHFRTLKGYIIHNQKSKVGDLDSQKVSPQHLAVPWTIRSNTLNWAKPRHKPICSQVNSVRLITIKSRRHPYIQHFKNLNKNIENTQSTNPIFIILSNQKHQPLRLLWIRPLRKNYFVIFKFTRAMDNLWLRLH